MLTCSLVPGRGPRRAILDTRVSTVTPTRKDMWTAHHGITESRRERLPQDRCICVGAPRLTSSVGHSARSVTGVVRARGGGRSVGVGAGENA